MDAYNNNDFTNLRYNEHIMLLYEDRNKCNNFIIDIINEGLKNGCLCIYASVDTDNSNSISLIDSLSSKIINYEENIQNENLKFTNTKPYYESALKGDLTVFEKWKLELEFILYKRLSEGKKDKILIVGDVACNLYETRNFKECIDLEKWWQEVQADWKRNNKDIIVVCPHPSNIFKENSLQYIKDKIGNSHNATIDIENEYSLQYFYNLISQSRKLDDLIKYEQTIKTMKEIKTKFMDEHKNIINAYYSLYSKRLDDIIYNNLNKSNIENNYSNAFSNTNRNVMDKQSNTTKIIDDIIDKNIDTFIKSIKFANKFYFDVVQSYYNYIMTINKLSES
jgi:MEDS: MEthanogen/methylotroph, DcmR Sensory domain